MRICNIDMGKTYKTKIEIGKFYMAYGGTPHPAFVFKIDERDKELIEQ